MIEGRVNPERKAVVPVDILDQAGRLRRVDTVIYTGFDLELALPAAMIRGFGLVRDDEIQMTLANGQSSRFQQYIATIIWHDRRREIRVLETADESIIGANLLWGSEVTMQMREYGSVAITEMPAQSSH